MCGQYLRPVKLILRKLGQGIKLQFHPKMAITQKLLVMQPPDFVWTMSETSKINFEKFRSMVSTRQRTRRVQTPPAVKYYIDQSSQVELPL